MFVFVVSEPGKESRVIKKIRKFGDITVKNDDEIIVKITKAPKNKSQETQLKNKFEKINGVLRAILVLPHIKVADVKLQEAFHTNRCVLFFDIDSTLTQGDPGNIHPKIESIFNKITDKGIRIFFITGRGMSDVSTLTKCYSVEKYAIAENGGIILGFGPDGYIEFGNKKEPKKILTYLQIKYSTPEDMKQGIRLTEVIFLQKDITLKRLNSVIKSKKAKVDIHPSKNSYHVSQRGINKGTAMLQLCKLLHIDNQMIIAIGDADMDIPMLKKADYSFAVGNASEGVKKAAKKVLIGKFEKGIEEIFDLITST